MQYTHHYISPLGEITLASDGNALTGLWFDDQKYFGTTLAEGFIPKELPVFEQTAQWLDLYFNGKSPDFTPPLLLNATPFRMAIWKILLTIPYGQTMTYGQIAGLAKASARAVGGAVGHNPISLIIPCHRVMGANGKLTGYAGGIARKEKLLLLEQSGHCDDLPG
ncbi:MAG: methylated-DNA--[protein]-cysteine S-methyltransferase [Acetatifactor sp.]|nr:methylated-DNA--[protein]-cysteine S-methyltransferase [Acetatifactor sp.]